MEKGLKAIQVWLATSIRNAIAFEQFAVEALDLSLARYGVCLGLLMIVAGAALAFNFGIAIRIGSPPISPQLGVGILIVATGIWLFLRSCFLLTKQLRKR